MRIAITGATGLLGRNLLFEIIKQNLSSLGQLELLLLGRSQANTPLEDRIDRMIAEDGLPYIGSNQVDAELTRKLHKVITPIASDLTMDGLGVSTDDLKILRERPIDHFFHIAAMTDFRSDNNVEGKLTEVNVRGTERVLALIETLEVEQVVYVGSAYACGGKTGKVAPDYINSNETFRNPYEKSKLQAEMAFRSFVQKRGLTYKIFRPSTICGRLIEKPIGSINKFDVFYAWGAFFLRYKYKHLKTIENIYAQPLELPMRIHFNPKSGLNVVPADFAAKVMYKIVAERWTDNSYYLSNNEETPHSLYVGMILAELGINGCSFVPEEPSDKNELEKFYYKTVGKLFTPYAAGEPMLFDVSNFWTKVAETGISCPKIDNNALRALIGFAKTKYFNLGIG